MTARHALRRDAQQRAGLFGGCRIGPGAAGVGVASVGVASAVAVSVGVAVVHAATVRGGAVAAATRAIREIGPFRMKWTFAVLTSVMRRRRACRV